MGSIKEAEVLVVLYKNRNKSKNKNGFSLIELIAVMLFLAVLAVTVLPRFINFQDDAEKAVVLATAASFKDALKLIRVKWILAGRPTEDFISYDDNQIRINDKGYPVSVNDTGDTIFDFDNFSTLSPNDASTKRCYDLFNNLLTSPSNNTYSNNAEELRNNTFFVSFYNSITADKEGDPDNYLGLRNACIYYLISNLYISESSSIEEQLINTNTHLSGFAYSTHTGEVRSFFNGFEGFEGSDWD